MTITPTARKHSARPTFRRADTKGTDRPTGTSIDTARPITSSPVASSPVTSSHSAHSQTSSRPTATVEATTSEGTTAKAGRYVAAALRLSLGVVFLWAFLDKAFALGFSTGRDGETGLVDRFGDAAWINGGSPTEGFLGFATKGPFADAYQSIAGATWADWGFMLGLAAIGTALLLGIGMRAAAVGGSVLLIMMWTAVLPPENNPFMDDHLVYAMVLVGLALAGAGRTLGLGARWERLSIVSRHSFLK